jgi:hypothetical protein
MGGVDVVGYYCTSRDGVFCATGSRMDAPVIQLVGPRYLPTCIWLLIFRLGGVAHRNVGKCLAKPWAFTSEACVEVVITVSARTGFWFVIHSCLCHCGFVTYLSIALLYT